MVRNAVRILAVDDEPRYTWAIQAVLQGVGYETLTAEDGESAIERAAVEQLDLILLDLRLPDLDGYEVCRRIREFSTTPIIMLTAMATEADKVKGLEAGADDYVTKPFGAQELVARVRAVLRRVEFSETQEPSALLCVGGLQVDAARQRVTVCGNEVSLTATEYRLLSEFVKQPDRVLVPEYLLDRVWGVGYEGENHMLRQVIYRLRRKIESDPSDPQYIQTKPGMGYVLVVPKAD
jgi:two-component system KDP operon response regulator KdpE